MMRPVLVKFGGAAITNKKVKYELQSKNLEDCVAGVAAAYRRGQKVVVIHGAGSFGHFEAKEFGVAQGRRENEFGFALTRRAVKRLNTIVIDALIAVGLPATSVSPFACDDLPKHLDTCLKGGLLPVVHGDAVIKNEDYAILSGDDIAQNYCQRFPVERVIFVTDVPGVYDANPKTHRTAKKWLAISSTENTIEATKGDVTDVTGGMRAKLEAAFAIAKIGIPVRILDAPSFHDALSFDLETFSSPEISSSSGTLITNH